MSAKKGLGRLYDRLTPEERFRLDVLAMARGDEEESERLTTTCPRRDYTMNDWDFVGRWEAARDLAMLAYVDVVRRLDKIKMIGAFRSFFPTSAPFGKTTGTGPTSTATWREPPCVELESQNRRAARLGSRRGGGGAQRRPHHRRGLAEVDGRGKIRSPGGEVGGDGA
jgi:hypothetical protein